MDRKLGSDFRPSLRDLMGWRGHSPTVETVGYSRCSLRDHIHSSANHSPALRQQAAFTLKELLVVIGMLSLIILVGLSAKFYKAVDYQARLVECHATLKLIGVGYTQFANDHNGQFPGEIFAGKDDVEAFRQFQMLSNYIGITYPCLVCLADDRPRSTNWSQLSNSNISYFCSLNASSNHPSMLLAGDGNLSLNSTSLSSGVYNLGTNSQVGWTKSRHRGDGNFLLVDGSVFLSTSRGLQQQLALSGITNRVSVP